MPETRPLVILVTERGQKNNLILATDLGALDPSRLESDLIASGFELGGGDIRSAEGDFGLWLLPQGSVRPSVEELARSGYQVVWNGEPVARARFDGGEEA